MRFRIMVKQRMVELGLTQTQVCTAARVSQCKLSMFLAGKKNLNTDTLERITDALGLHSIRWGLCRLPGKIST